MGDVAIFWLCQHCEARCAGSASPRRVTEAAMALRRGSKKMRFMDGKFGGVCSCHKAGRRRDWTSNLLPITADGGTRILSLRKYCGDASPS